MMVDHTGGHLIRQLYDHLTGNDNHTAVNRYSHSKEQLISVHIIKVFRQLRQKHQRASQVVTRRSDASETQEEVNTKKDEL